MTTRQTAELILERLRREAQATVEAARNATNSISRTYMIGQVEGLARAARYVARDYPALLEGFPRWTD